MLLSEEEKKVLRIVSEYLMEYKEIASNRTCDDLDLNMFKDWSELEKHLLVDRISQWDGDNPDVKDLEDVTEWYLLWYLADWLEKEISK